MDRARTGFLSGVQARNVMVQSKLPQNILAQIWALSDMDADGQLSCEEFVLAMHLCEQATQGVMPPVVLPADLIPPIFRRAPRTGSVSSQGSIPQETSEHPPLHHQSKYLDQIIAKLYCVVELFNWQYRIIGLIVHLRCICEISY